MAKPKTDELVTTTTDSMAIPDYLREENSGAGLENLDRNELRLPRLAIAQGLSPQLDPDKPEYIEDLKLGDLFNSVTGEVFGRGPFLFTVLRIEKPRYIEFIPRDLGGGVKDMNVPGDDPRTKFTLDADGNTVQPAATKFLDFLVAQLPLPADPNEAAKRVIALSCKSTALKAAKNLNSLLFYRSPKPTYAARFALTTTKETNKKGTYFVPSIVNAPEGLGGGWILDQAEFALSKALFTSLATANVVVDREPGSDDDEGAEGIAF